jgi:hypothetical protein
VPQITIEAQALSSKRQLSDLPPCGWLTMIGAPVNDLSFEMVRFRFLAVRRRTSPAFGPIRVMISACEFSQSCVTEVDFKNDV